MRNSRTKRGNARWMIAKNVKDRGGKYYAPKMAQAEENCVAPNAISQFTTTRLAAMAVGLISNITDQRRRIARDSIDLN
jgi:hypothetical protein